MVRKNPFQPLYDRCNRGNSKQKYAELPAFPYMVDVELTNTCNFRCLMCPTGNFSIRRPKGFMKKEVFYKILDEIEPHGSALRLIRWGEPMMHPDIMEFIRAASDRGILTHLNTNGSYLDEESIHELIDAGLSVLKYSFQGVDQASYEEMRNTDFFDELVEIMRLFKKIRGERPLPFLMLTTTITYETPEQVAFFKDLVGDLVDHLSVGRTLLDFIDLEAVRLRAHEFELLKKLKEEETVEKVHLECPEVFDKLSVNVNGDVTACCKDSDNKMLLGSVVEQTLEEIWTCDQMTYYREMLAEMRHDEMPLCKFCYDFHGIQNPGIQKT